jgi:Protein of unknown function (DUF3592)
LVTAALFAAAAVLFNPLIPFHFRRETWLLLDKVSLGVVIGFALIWWAKLEPPTILEHWFKWLAWLIVAGLVTYYIAEEGIHLYGKYALATTSTTATVTDIEEDVVDSDTGIRRYINGVYEFVVGGKTYYGRTDKDDVGEKLVVRYNPANPDDNRDPTRGFLAAETTSFIGFIIIGAALYYWLKWILQSEKTLPCIEHPDRRTKKRFYHWVEDGRFHYVVDHGPHCNECLAQLRELHRTDGCSEFLYKPLPESFSVPSGLRS